MFLNEHASDILDQIARGLRLVTLSVRCEFFEELSAFCVVEIRMSLAYPRHRRIGLAFDYVVRRGGAESLAARDFQEIGRIRAEGQEIVPALVPVTSARHSHNTIQRIVEATCQ